MPLVRTVFALLMTAASLLSLSGLWSLYDHATQEDLKVAVRIESPPVQVGAKRRLHLDRAGRLRQALFVLTLGITLTLAACLVAEVRIGDGFPMVLTIMALAVASGLILAAGTAGPAQAARRNVSGSVAAG